MQREMKRIVDSTSWDVTAQAMHGLIEKELAKSAPQRIATPAAQAANDAARKTRGLS